MESESSIGSVQAELTPKHLHRQALTTLAIAVAMFAGVWEYREKLTIHFMCGSTAVGSTPMQLSTTQISQQASSAKLTNRKSVAWSFSLQSDQADLYGHVGIVTNVGNGKVRKVIHCSSGNFRKYGDAIRETPPTVFQVPDAVFVWFEGIEKREAGQGTRSTNR